MSPKLDVYLRTYRLKSGLTQRDLAFLLSLQSGSVISKIERKHQIPSLRTFLAYCVIFDAQPIDITPGLLRDIENAVLNRANALARDLGRKGDSAPIIQRIAFLNNLPRSFRAQRQYDQCKEGKRT